MPDELQPTHAPPGGGSWRWDAELADWVPNDPAPAEPQTDPVNNED